MANEKRIFCYGLFLLTSLALNFSLITNQYLGIELQSQKLSWSLKAAAEAEAVALISCSGHGKAFLDGLIVNGNPICECNTCYGGSDCSVFSPDCSADANMAKFILKPLRHIRYIGIDKKWNTYSQFYSKTQVWYILGMGIPIPTGMLIPKIIGLVIPPLPHVHKVAKNAITKGKYVVFGGGSTQLLAAAVYALSMNLSSSASVVASAPYYPLYRLQTNYFQNAHFRFDEDASLRNNSSYSTEANVIEIVTSPNNPDGNLKAAVSQGPSVKVIYDHAYYWPHFTAIPSPVDEDVTIFTMSKLTGHAGSRDEKVYEVMKTYMSIASIGISREAQLRALQLMKVILDGNGTHIFDYAAIVSLSSRFSIQEIPLLFCNFFEKVRGPSPAYAWVKCEREEDTNCIEVLLAANILSREGSLFSVEDRYVRLSLLKSDDEFNLLMHHLGKLVAEEDGAKTA
ncbi:hypothetical protein ABFX02_03G010300 [Erythranthe guttata]